MQTWLTCWFGTTVESQNKGHGGITSFVRCREEYCRKINICALKSVHCREIDCPLSVFLCSYLKGVIVLQAVKYCSSLLTSILCIHGKLICGLSVNQMFCFVHVCYYLSVGSVCSECSITVYYMEYCIVQLYMHVTIVTCVTACNHVNAYMHV